MGIFQENNKGYGDYRFSDFLQDDFFISSVLNPTSDTIFFWNRIMEKYPNIVADFAKAKRYIELIQHSAVDINLEETEKSDMWTSIVNRNAAARTNRKKSRWLLGVVSVASAVILGIFLTRYSGTSSEPLPNIMDFTYLSFNVSEYKETILILSDSNKVEVSGRESVISYDKQDTITVNMRKISREDTNPYNLIVVPQGKRSFVTLPDGTTMWVNSGSIVVFPPTFERNKREIYVDGEVFLDVAKEQFRPFIVRTKNTSIEVKGTKFNVSSYKSTTTTSVVLVEGSLLIKHDMTPTEYLLRPNEIFECTEDGNTSIEKADVNRFVSWVDGYYIYEYEYLMDVISHLSKYYDKTIECDASAAVLVCSGKLEMNEDFEKVVQGLAYALPVSVECKDNIYHITHIK